MQAQQQQRLSPLWVAISRNRSPVKRHLTKEVQNLDPKQKSSLRGLVDDVAKYDSEILKTNSVDPSQTFRPVVGKEKSSSDQSSRQPEPKWKQQKKFAKELLTVNSGRSQAVDLRLISPYQCSLINRQQSKNPSFNPYPALVQSMQLNESLRRCGVEPMKLTPQQWNGVFLSKNPQQFKNTIDSIKYPQKDMDLNSKPNPANPIDMIAFQSSLLFIRDMAISELIQEEDMANSELIQEEGMANRELSEEEWAAIKKQLDESEVISESANEANNTLDSSSEKELSPEGEQRMDEDRNGVEVEKKGYSSPALSELIGVLESKITQPEQTAAEKDAGRVAEKEAASVRNSCRPEQS